MPVLHLTAADDDVFRGHGHASPVVVAAGVDRYAIIAGRKRTVLDQNIAARLRIATVCIWPSFVGGVGFALDVHAAYGHIRAEHGMNLPHRRTSKRDSFDQNVLTAIWLQEHRTQITSFPEDSFAHGGAFRDVLVKQTAGVALFVITFFPATARASFPRPPIFAISLAVDDPFAGDRDVLLLKGIDKRRVAHQFHTFPTREHIRQILSWVLTEFDRGSSSQMKIDVALEMNRAGRKLSGRNDDTTATRAMAGIDRFAKCICAINLTVTHRTKFCDVEISLRKDRCLDPIQNLRKEDLPGTVCLRQTEGCRKSLCRLRQYERACATSQKSFEKVSTFQHLP